MGHKNKLHIMNKAGLYTIQTNIRASSDKDYMHGKHLKLGWSDNLLDNTKQHKKKQQINGRLLFWSSHKKCWSKVLIHLNEALSKAEQPIGKRD